MGYYHYHHGYGPHLHPGGVCPYTSANSVGSPNATAPSSSPSVPDTPGQAARSEDRASLTDAENEVVLKAQDAIRQAGSNGTSPALVTLTTENELTLAAMQEISRLAKASGIAVVINCDVTDSSGLVLRLKINPALATKTVQLGGSINNRQTESVKQKYQSLYVNHAEVISLSQQGSFGMVMEIIAKIDLSSLNTTTLQAYSYNQQTNSHTRIPQEDCFVDANGYLHITTSLAGDIVITDEDWKK